MFSSSQILFAKIFVIVFVLFMIILYRKDLKIQRQFYPKVWQVGLSIIVVIVLFTILVFSLHK
ncbi:MAG: hypothetical protein COS42_02660 [Flavobacteriales bacterium CG03_land_8_20_14_0_80_35_15]|nr:MAG: hypothetical protein COV50_04370 [Flavobacteriales bacterium CG11_big_fil_rev_8_21_14_0_20_35_7]PIV18067.1 MAG: hypothetical protein COS42_02660 [Flavobacteriales bacterium CG03_land_8_20_14_0_80_35_15]PIX06108.1 MAG: hypothetical protein COZ76_10630 [Flavobacteriales bacterium CG_4_8_14_3_um_filter_35_10]